MARIVVTGGAGFIGCAVAPALLAAGHDVVAIDSLHPQVHPAGVRPAALPQEVTLVQADVTSPDTWDDVLSSAPPDVVVHLAAETGTGQSLTEAGRHAHVNVVGTAVMLDGLSRHRVVPGHVLLASSRAVYGEGAWRDDDGRVVLPGPRQHADLAAGRWTPRGPGGEPLTPLPSIAGRTQVEPTSIYGATKLTQEHMLRAWASAFGSALSVLRLQNVYGPGQSPHNSYTGIVTLFARLAAEGGQISVYEDGLVVRDFVHVADVVRALSAALSTPPSGHRVVDVGSGRGTTIFELAALIASLSGAREPIVTGEFRDGDVRHASTDATPLADELAVVPSVTLEEGLTDVQRWMAETQTR